MTLKRLETEFDGKFFMIKEDLPEVGAYLYVFEGERCIQDILQNDIEACKEFAFEIYKVPVISWNIVMDDSGRSV